MVVHSQHQLAASLTVMNVGNKNSRELSERDGIKIRHSASEARSFSFLKPDSSRWRS